MVAKAKVDKVEEERKKFLIERDHLPEDVHSYRINRHDFTLYVGGDPHVSVEAGDEPGVEHHMADRFEINLAILATIDPTRPILVNLSSVGGNWDHGMKIFGAMLYCPNPITVLGTYDCRSMTSIIPLAADKFVMRPPAQYMFHLGTMGYEGHTTEFKTIAEELEKLNEMMLRIYTARLKSQGMHKEKSEDEIKKIVNESMRDKMDVYLSTDEAQKWGFTDDVFEGNWKTLRTTKVNEERRKLMRAVLRRRIRTEPAKAY